MHFAVPLAAPIGLVVLTVLFFLFLLVLGGLSVAAGRGFGRRSQGDDARGGCLSGCFSGAALLFLGLLGLAGFAGFLVLGAGLRSSSLLERIELGWPERDGARTELDASRDERARLAFEVRGDLGGELSELVREIAGDDLELRVQRGQDERGPFAVFEFYLPFDRRDLRELEERVERELQRSLSGRGVRFYRARDL
jgi:hypothetical protein